MNETQQAFQSVDLHRAIFTVEDDEGLPLPLEEVSIALDAQGAKQQEWRCRVNGSWVSLDNDDYFRTRTNAVGQVVVEISADVSLWAPGIRLSRSNGETQTVYPTAPIRAVLETIDGAALRARKNKLTGEPVIPADIQEHCDSIANAVSYLFKATSSFAPGGNKRTPQPPKRGGRLRFETDSSGVALSWNPFEIFDEGAKLVNGAISTVPLSQIVEGVASVTIKPVEWALDHVGDKVLVGVQYVVDGVQYGLQAVLGSEVDVFGAAKSILDSVGKLAGNIPVFGNLVKSFLDVLFNFPEINRLRGELRELIKEKARALASEVPDKLPSVDAWLQVRENITEIVSKLSLDKTFTDPLGKLSYRDKTILPSLNPSQMASINDHNIWDALNWLPRQLSAYGMAESLLPKPTDELLKLRPKFEELVEKVIGDFADLAKFAQDIAMQQYPAEAFLQKPLLPLLKDLEPSQILTKLLNGKLFEDLAEFSKKCISSFDKLVEWSDEPCQIPFLSEFLPLPSIPGTDKVDLGPCSILNTTCLGAAVALHAARLRQEDADKRGLAASASPEVEKGADVVFLYGYAGFNTLSEGLSGRASAWIGSYGDVMLIVPLILTINQQIPNDPDKTARELLIAAWSLDIAATGVDFLGNVLFQGELAAKKWTDGKTLLMALLSAASVSCFIAGYCKLTDKDKAKSGTALAKNIGISGTNIIRPYGVFVEKKPWQYLALQGALGLAAAISNTVEKYG